MVGSRWLGLLGSIHDIARRTNGAELYPIALAASFVLGYGSYGYFVAVLALGLGDAAAAIVGDHFGHRRFVCWGSQRTVEGSLAAAATTALATAAVLIVAGERGPVDLLLVALAVGCSAALGEVVSPRGLDNLVMPLAALAALTAAGSPPVLIALFALLVVTAAIGVRPRRPLARLTAATGVAAIDAPDHG
jgi:phytol kinase